MQEFASSDAFRFEAFVFDPHLGSLYRVDADANRHPVAIGARALQVLEVLLASHGKVVSKQEIMNVVWPSVSVEENNLTVQISSLRRALDAGRKDSVIQTVPGRGYRFVPRVSRVDGVEPEAPARSRAGRRVRPIHWILIACLAAIVAAAAWFWTDAPPMRPGLSLAVMPFQNLGGSPADEYLADGITEDLTTDLSGISGMFVIARTTAYTYKGKSLDARVIGDDLGVRYVVEGSVQKLDGSLRVNAQLIDTGTGQQLWGDRFDQPVKDMSTGQDAIVRQIGETLNVAITDIESARLRREHPTNPDAFDLILRAESIWLHPMGPREAAEKRDLFQQAVKLDPTSIRALTGLAYSLIADQRQGDDLEEASKLIDRAAALDPNDEYVLGAQAFLAYHRGRCVDAIFAYHHLLDVYPNAAFAWRHIGACLTAQGRANEAIPVLQTFLRYDPHGAYAWAAYADMGRAMFILGRDQDAIDWTERALAANPNNRPEWRAAFTLRIAMSQARLGHLDTAHRLVAKADAIWPYYTVRWLYSPAFTIRSDTDQENADEAAARLAGVRDHVDENADLHVPTDDALHDDDDLAGLTPVSAPGATTVSTSALQQLLASHHPLLLDTLWDSRGKSLPGAIGLRDIGWGGTFDDVMQQRLEQKMRELTGGDMAKPIVAVGWNAERFDGRNLTLRLVRLGYTHVYWYRGGREAWAVAGLPEADVTQANW